MKKFKPKCVADMKDPRCHFYIRLYEKSIYMDNENVDKDYVTVNKGFQAQFIEEIEANFIEWFQGDYRLSFPFDGEGSEKPYYGDVKLLFISYPDDAKFVEHNEFVFVLVIKAESGLKSVCI